MMKEEIVWQVRRVPEQQAACRTQMTSCPLAAFVLPQAKSAPL